MKGSKLVKATNEGLKKHGKKYNANKNLAKKYPLSNFDAETGHISCCNQVVTCYTIKRHTASKWHKKWHQQKINEENKSNQLMEIQGKADDNFVEGYTKTTVDKKFLIEFVYGCLETGIPLKRAVRAFSESFRRLGHNILVRSEL